MARALCGCGVGLGGIIINVVVAFKGVRRCGCFEDPCSTSRALCGCAWVGGWGGAGELSML